MKWDEILPVLVSIVVIVLVAVLRRQSELAAAITATMPLNAPLGLWIVYAAAGGERGSVTRFTSGMVVGILPSLGFLLVVWLAARAGMRLAPMIVLGYAAWGIGLGALLLVRRLWAG